VRGKVEKRVPDSMGRKIEKKKGGEKSKFLSRGKKKRPSRSGKCMKAAQPKTKWNKET